MNSLGASRPFAFLAFGRLGKSAEKSLLSIDELLPSRIYILVDSSAEKWLNEELIHKLRSETILLRLSESKFSEVGVSDCADHDYSEYGINRFNRITALKWQLILKIFSEYGESNCFFSDLDVLWFDLPEESDFQHLDGKFVYAQDDTNVKLNRTHFCTGLMYWKNTSESIKVLNQLYKVQVERLNAGEMVNDEHIFNFLINSNNSIKNTAGIMQKDQFVIGHRFFSVLLTRAFKNMKAFHVNYVRGEKYKLRRMKILSRRSRMRQLFSIFLLLEFARKGREITSRQLRS